ncbi:hypothetical protein GCM10020229_28390 [Kitasatospora albolonga]
MVVGQRLHLEPLEAPDPEAVVAHHPDRLGAVALAPVGGQHGEAEVGEPVVRVDPQDDAPPSTSPLASSNHVKGA